MSLFNVFDIAGSGMSAHSIRLNTVASNLSNAESAAGSEKEVYRARQAIFQATDGNDFSSAFNKASQGVEVTDVIESDKPVRTRYQPDHALADEEGYVYYPNVNVMEEMANMISASRTYQSNIQVLQTAKTMMLKTLQLGQ